MTNHITPLELLNLYYSDGQSTGNKDNKLWQKMNSLLSWDNILDISYQSDLCPLLYYIITKTTVLDKFREVSLVQSSSHSPQNTNKPINQFTNQPVNRSTNNQINQTNSSSGIPCAMPNQ